MPNTLTANDILGESARVLHENCPFIGSIQKSYDPSFDRSGGKRGVMLRIPKPIETVVRTGMAMVPQDTVQETVALTVASVMGTDLTFTALDLSRNIGDFSKEIIQPSMKRLASNLEAAALGVADKVANTVDNTGSAMSLNAALEAKILLNNNLANADRQLLMNSRDAVDFVKDTKALFNSNALIGDQYRKGTMGEVAGFMCSESSILAPHTTGTAAATTGYLVNGASQTGAALTVDTGSTTFLIGDVITIAGVNAVHAETKADLGYLQNFVITANSGASATSLAIDPPIITSGGRQTVSGSPADNAAVSKIAAVANEQMKYSLAYDPDAFVFATAKLQAPSPSSVDMYSQGTVDGISMMLTRQFQISDLSFPTRIDVLWGVAAVYPQLAVRICNN